MRAQFALIAEFAREGTKKKFDILGVLDRVWAKALPAQHRQLAFVVLVVADTEDDLGRHPFRMSFQTPTGQTVFEQRGHFELRPTAGTFLSSARLIFEIGGLPLAEYGRHQFVLKVGEQTIATHPLSVRPAEEMPNGE